MKPNDSELNDLPYFKAREIDKRSYCEYYISLLKTGHIIIFTLFLDNDYNSRIIKIFLFFFVSIIDFTVNTLFFNDSTMHKIYLDEGDFNFLYQIPQILLSSLIAGALSSIFKLLSLSEKYILLLKQENNLKIIKNKERLTMKLIKRRFIFFFILSFILLIVFGFYVSCFCAVYTNTQMHLIKDFLISFGVALIYPFGVYLIPGIFRIFALREKNKKKNGRKCLYDFSKIFQMI